MTSYTGRDKMLNLFKIQTFLKKSWVWLKHNWKLPAILVYTLALWFLFRKKDAAYRILEERNRSYQKQIEAVDSIHKDEIKKRDKILERYNDILGELEKKYQEDSREIDEKKKKEIKNLVEKYDEQPDELAKLLAEKFGLQYVDSSERARRVELDRRLKM